MRDSPSKKKVNDKVVPKSASSRERKTQPTLKYALLEAQGISQFVIVVFVDVRGFSKFSKNQESPDVAMFLKRFYLELIDKYFQRAGFFKPTGDGLLMTFPYNDKTLYDVATNVIQAIMQCLNEFPSMLKSDPMINFSVPENIGFGLARGTACCLQSGNSIIDYSGHLLNLAARLTELARPNGVIIDGGFQKDLIPKDFRDRFDEAEVFIRSIAESEPTPVFFLADSTKIPQYALHPIESKRYMRDVETFLISELDILSRHFTFYLSDKANLLEPVKIIIKHPKVRGRKVLEGYATYAELAENHFEVIDDIDTKIKVDLDVLREMVKDNKVPKNQYINLEINYVAR